MGLNVNQYLEQLKSLLPRGLMWSSEDGDTLDDLLGAMAEELARIDARAEGLFNETDPRTTLELLDEWEAVAGLPDTCTDQADTLAERRDVLHAKITSIGNQSRQYFIDLAAALGYTVTITEFRPFVAGSNAGDALTNGDWIFTWRVNAPAVTERIFVAGSAAGEPLRDWGNEILECVINKYKPAHTLVQFGYGG